MNLDIRSGDGMRVWNEGSGEGCGGFVQQKWEGWVCGKGKMGRRRKEYEEHDGKLPIEIAIVFCMVEEVSSTPSMNVPQSPAALLFSCSDTFCDKYHFPINLSSSKSHITVTPLY
jgi:hypothetical protein